MRFPRPSSASVLVAGILVLAAATAQAQTRAAAGDENGKDGKRTQGTTARPADTHQMRGKDTPKDHADESDMIMLQEPFRPGPSMPVSATRGR